MKSVIFLIEIIIIAAILSKGFELFYRKYPKIRSVKTFRISIGILVTLVILANCFFFVASIFYSFAN